MKGRHHPANDITINPSPNPSIREVIDRVDPARRRFIRTSMSASTLAALGGVSLGGFIEAVEAAPIAPSTGFAGIGFESVPPNLLDPVTGNLQKDLVSVPKGYKAEVLIAWGDPIMPTAKNWNPAATQDAAEQEKQYGMHNDGMHYFPLPSPGASERGLLCVNHEYTDENLLHGAEGLSGGAGPTIAKVRKSQAAHGVSVIEVFKGGNQWRVQRASRYGRRITANTPMRVSGPAAGHDLLKSKKYSITPTGSFDTGMVNDGRTAYGTANNCAHGYTPWGTYITCEENWNGYFGAVPSLASAQLTKDERRLGITAAGFGYRWHEVDERWDIRKNPKEQFLFGWRVEIDPFDPQRVPVKRTALGRFKCESAQVVVDDSRRVAFYMGDDERNEYIYKFVCARPFTPNDKVANRDMLDHGTLYVARFAADGTGTWIALLPGTDTVIDDPGTPGRKLKLRELADFRGASDAEVQALISIRTRMAADAVGATMMDRPEWCAARPRIAGFQEIEVYCTLTNNSRRGNRPASVNRADGATTAASANPPVDAANPRPDNDYGHIVRWRETGRSVAATTFQWDLFVLCGDKQAAAGGKTLPSTYEPAGYDGYVGNINGDDYGAPDGLWFDDQGRLWIQTDQAGDGRGDWVNIGGNVMVCADPNTRQTRRFLTSPTDCEVTGVVTSPDGRAMFVNIQHPGDRATPDEPTRSSHWPYSQGYGPAGRPRSATVVITREDGGIVGGL
jgi:secreted PhoX family phosphatase